MGGILDIFLLVTNIINIVLYFIVILYTRYGIIYSRVVNGTLFFRERVTSYFRYYSFIVRVKEITKIYYVIDT